jgi:peptidoglycan hydrolase CwlO-like protein
MEKKYCFVLVFHYAGLFLTWQSEYTKLEVDNAHLEKQISELRGQTSKTSNKLNFLEKQNLQLQRELEKATV